MNLVKEMTRRRFASSVVGHPDSWTQQKFEFCCVIKGQVCGGGQESIITRLICELILHLPNGEVRRGQGCFFFEASVFVRPGRLQYPLAPVVNHVDTPGIGCRQEEPLQLDPWLGAGHDV